MSGDQIKSTGSVNSDASLSANSGQKLGVNIEHTYHVECWRGGELVWSDDFHNLVTYVGLQTYLDAALKTGIASPAWYVGLITGPGASNTYAQGDTMGSHPWSEDTTYSNGSRPAWTPGSISTGVSPATVDNSASKAVFNINGTATIAGCFMVDSSTKGGTSGSLIGEGNFTGGDRAVQNGDTLNVTVTATMS